MAVLQSHSKHILRGESPLDTAPCAPPSVTTLPQLFRHKAASQPHNIAFSCQTEHGLSTITYAEAHATAERLANHVSQLPPDRHAHDDPAPVVAIWLEKGLDLILSILATTYSGATWLPFDPDVPEERAATCILDASASALICDDAHLDRARDVQQRVAATLVAANKPSLQVRTFAELSTDSSSPAEPTALDSTPRPRPRDAAYLIYTSGTTGTPKGIAIPHSAALVFSISEREVLQTGPKDIVWNGFSPAFDMFVEEMWVTIAGGGHLAVGTRRECRDQPALPEIWEKRGVTVVNAVPSLIGLMAATDNPDGTSLFPASVRLINLGGEAIRESLVDRLAAPGLRLINTYGPTETTVTATWDELQAGVPVTIGRPLPSYHACLLPIAEDDAPVSVQPLELAEGVEGELAIGGPCVGLGYVGREKLTAEKFIPHPLDPTSGELLYRTGDRVKLQADMKILFLGRIDTQVKHRGFRIELGEIESRLSSHADVQAAAVILANSGTDEARLEAFVVTRADADRDAAPLHQLAVQHLPSYMRPERIYFLDADEMPRLASGKINGKALHEVSVRKAAEYMAELRHADDDTAESSVDYDSGSPLGILMVALAAMFPQAGRIKPTVDFFNDLGGHSLLAANLVSRLRRAQLDSDGSHPFASIGLQDLYDARTPADIAARFTHSDDSDGTTLGGGSEYGGDDADGTGARTGDFLPISHTRFVLCGIAQLVPLLVLFFIQSIEILVPYLLFDFLTLHRDVGRGILAAYGVFVATPPALTVLALAVKWLVLGKAKEGEYPLYGFYYFRWWVAERFVAFISPKLIADSALYPAVLRALGAKAGKFCHLGPMAIGAACDLVEIGDDVVVGADVVLAVSMVERGKLILKKVVIERDAIIGANCVLEGGAIVEEAAEVGPLSMVPDGMRVPSCHRYHGSPARLDRKLKDGEAALGHASRPSAARGAAILLGNFLIATFFMPLLYLLPQIPGLLLFDLLDLRRIGGWAQVAVLSVPIALLYQILIFTQLIVVRHLILGRLKEGTYKIYSSWYLRKWLVERSMDLAMAVLHPVFATLYIVPFLRALGVKIGKRAEVSTARGLMFELLEIGEESFVADSVMLGGCNVRGNEVTLMKTKLEARAFAGNACMVPPGTTLASETLVGVLSIAPPLDKPLLSGTSCFGSPPVRMPTRQKAQGHADHLLFHPSARRKAARLFIEGCRIILPRAVLIFGLGFSLQIIYVGYRHIGAVPTLLMLPLIYFFMFALPALFLTALLKWILIGRYKTAEWALWSLNVWLSEAVTSTWETITEPLLAVLLIGTPYMAWCFRLMGVKIGSRVTLLASDITEYDCVTIGDEAIINDRCGTQTHLFEDRVMKVGCVSLGKRSCLKPYSVCLPGSVIADYAQVGCLSLVMKGEQLPEATAWEGAPVEPRANRRRRAFATAATTAPVIGEYDLRTGDARFVRKFESRPVSNDGGSSETAVAVPSCGASTLAEDDAVVTVSHWDKS